MPRILYGVSPIGLGHATRALVMTEALRAKGADVRVFSGGVAAEFLRRIGVKVDDIVEDPVPSISGLEMRRVTLWYIRSWLANRRTVSRTERLFDSFSPDLVVCDEEWSGLVVAGRRGVKRALVADELQLGFARSWLARKVEARVERWFRNLQDSVDLLVIPEPGEDSGNKRHVGPIVRQTTCGCPEARSRYGLPAGKMVLFSISGSGVGAGLAAEVSRSLKEARVDGVYLAVTGNRGPRLAGDDVYDLGLVEDNQNLVACADLVVSTAGKSTIDEAASAGTPIIVVPILHHAEQERNARALGCDSRTIEHLADLMKEKIGKRGAPQDFRGEQAASQLVMSLL